MFKKISVLVVLTLVSKTFLGAAGALPEAEHPSTPRGQGIQGPTDKELSLEKRERKKSCCQLLVLLCMACVNQNMMVTNEIEINSF